MIIHKSIRVQPVSDTCVCSSKLKLSSIEMAIHINILASTQSLKGILKMLPVSYHHLWLTHHTYYLQLTR